MKSKLSEEQRQWLEAMIHISRTPAKHYLVARVQLMSDQSQGEPSHTDGYIACVRIVRLLDLNDALLLSQLLFHTFEGHGVGGHGDRAGAHG